VTTVRLAGPADRDQLVRTVAGAFSNDPAWAYLCAGDYERIAPLFAGALFDVRVGGGTVWMTEDAAAVSMWDAPDADGDHEELWRSYRQEAGEPAWQRLSLYDAALRACQPAEPFWYLGVLASDATRRREGLATAVMGPGLMNADRDGLKACLETSTPENKRFYANRGFAAPIELDVGGGPTTWWLTRQPA
jgi:hypothetical protein